MKSIFTTLPRPQQGIMQPLVLVSLLLFAVASGTMYVVTHLVIPFLSHISGQEAIIFWFLCGGTCVFLPMLMWAVLLLRKEKANTQETIEYNFSTFWRERLRFRTMNTMDWAWTLFGMVSIGVLSVIITLVLHALLPEASSQPDFMHLKPLTPDRYWLLGAWLPFWLLNIWGEEILWRGVILPKQEKLVGKNAWLLNASGWALFHVAFGGVLMLTLTPILIILPYLVQKRQNSWIGLIIHAGLNGPGFLAVAFGLV